MQRQGFRLALTGGPGGGKTTAADLFRRELGDEVVIVPEAATLLFTGGFPRRGDPESVRAVQRAIYFIQIGLEETQSAAYPGRILLCDRGTVDGGAYWHGNGNGSFFEEIGTSLEAELSRYDAVIFFETAAVGGISIEGGNPIRNEGQRQAIDLDHRLRAMWSQHPHFVFVPHMPSFFKKLTFGLASIEGIVRQLRGDNGDLR